MRYWFSTPHGRRPYVALVAGLAFLATACGQGSAQPTAAQPSAAQTSASAAPATATSAPTVSVVAKSVPTAVARQPAASAAASPAAVAAAPAGSVRLSLVPSGTEARFIARELLAAATIQSDAIGTTKEVIGQVLVGPDGQIGAGSKITVNLQSLKSDRDLRDNFIKRNTIQTSQFPNAEFVPKEAQGLATPLPTSGEASFKLLGDMTVHGVTKPVTWDVTATFSGQDVTGKATTVVRLDTFGMQTPRVPTVASIDDNLRLELDFKASRGS